MSEAGHTGTKLDADERAELEHLRRENAELRSERELVDTAASFVAPERAAPPRSPEKIILLTAQGHVHDMMQQGDYAADLGRAQDPYVFYWQPIGNWDAYAVPLGPPCDAGFAEGKKLLTETHPVGPVALCGFSQGAIVISRLAQWMWSDPAQKSRFIGGVTFGNPMREQGSYAGTKDPGGHGIASSRLVNTPKDIWRDYADPEDFYTSVEEPWADDCTAIYDIAMYGNPMRLILAIIKLITGGKLPIEALAALEAMLRAGKFYVTDKQLPHNRYELNECAGTGRTYFEDAVAFMRQLGAQAKAAPAAVSPQTL